MTKVTLTVNGKSVTRDVEGRTLLVQLLREDLELTGTHVGCDTSQCGACVVHVNGAAVKSCTVFAADLDGAEVRTIEGMAAADGTLSPLQQAFQDHHGLQCGFCTPGMVMSAASSRNWAAASSTDSPRNWPTTSSGGSRPRSRDRPIPTLRQPPSRKGKRAGSSD